MLVPLLHQLLALIIVHSLPLDELSSLCLLLDAVQHSTNNQHESQKAHSRNLMPVHDARQCNAQQNARSHDQRKYNCTEVFDGVKDKELTNRAADAKKEKVQMDFRVLQDKRNGGRQFVRMDQRHSAEDSRKGRRGKHEFDDAQVEMPLEHARLELRREGIKEEKEAKQHDTRPFGGGNFWIAQVVLAEAELQVIRGGHEEADAHANHQGYQVIVGRVCEDKIDGERGA